MDGILRLTSRQNERVAAACALKRAPENGTFFLEGARFVTDAGADAVKELFVTDASRFGTLCDAVLKQGGAVYEVTEPVMEKLCSGTQDICAVVRLAPKPLPERLVLLDAVQDPGNVGTVVRTAAAFGYGVVVGDGCADPFSAKAVQSSAGGILTCPTVRDRLCEAIPRLQQDGFEVWSAELDDTAMTHTAAVCPKRLALVIGNEGNGVSQAVSALCDKKIYIPIHGVNSLNAAVAAAVLMDRFRKETV